MQDRPSRKESAGQKTDDQHAVQDAVHGNWVDRYAPDAAKPYLRMSRADRPVGTWLLWIPCLLGALLASGEAGVLSPLAIWLMVSSGIGAILMRGAGCTWNDIADRNIDAKVARTKSRPLPSGQITVKQAFIWMSLQILIAFAILLTYPPVGIALGVAALIPAAIYPFAKRFTWWPQFFLGIAFNWGILLCYGALTGGLSAAAFFLYIACIAWTLFYDTIYAFQDKEDDALIGVKSTARLFENNAPVWLKRFLVMTVVFMSAAVIEALADRSLLALVVGAAGAWAMGLHMTVQLSRLNPDDPTKCLQLFRSNTQAGLIAALFFAIAVFL